MRTLSISFRYSAAAPKPVKPQDSTGGVSARFLCAPSANTQAQIDAAAARDADLARRVALADLNQLQGVRISELQALVDGFITADRQFLQLPGGIIHLSTSHLLGAYCMSQVWRLGNEDSFTSTRAPKAYIIPLPQYGIRTIFYVGCSESLKFYVA